MRLFKENSYLSGSRAGIGANSLDLSAGPCFLKRTGNVIDKAGASDVIVGVNETQAVYTSDNQTVALKVVNFVPTEAHRLYEVAITGGTITVAKEGYYYNLSTSVLVDGTTESSTPYYVNTSDAGAAADPVISKQLKLVQFKSATNSVFEIVNLV